MEPSPGTPSLCSYPPTGDILDLFFKCILFELNGGLVLHNSLYGPGLENDSACLGCPSYKVDRTMPAFSVGLEGSDKWQGSREGKNTRNCSRLGRPAFLLPHAQGTTLVVCQGNLTQIPATLFSGWVTLSK